MLRASIRARKTYSLECRQSVPPTPGQPVKEPMVIPLALGLVGKDGRDLPLRPADGETIERGVLVLGEPSRAIEFTGIEERPVLSINRGFSAPIKLSTDLDNSDLAFLAAHDSDPFNRWQALQTISVGLLIDNVAALRAGKAPQQQRQTRGRACRHSRGRRAGACLYCTRADAAGRRRYCARDRARYRSRRHFSARRHLRVEIGKRLGPLLSTIYERMTVAGGYSPDAASAGRRALRNIALDLLAAGGSADGAGARRAAI